jgi:hypothetical protein
MIALVHFRVSVSDSKIKKRDLSKRIYNLTDLLLPGLNFLPDELHPGPALLPLLPPLLLSPEDIQF